MPKEQKKFHKLGNLPAALPVAPPSPTPAAPEAARLVAAPPAPTVAPTVAAAPVVEEVPPVSPPEPSPSPAGPATPGAGRVIVRPERGSTPVEERTGGRRRSISRKQRVLMIAMGVSSAVGSFFVGLFIGWLGRPPAAKGIVPAAAASSSSSPAGAAFAALAMVPDEGMRRALATVDEAEAAHRAGDWTRMDALLEQAGREAGPRGIPGLLFHRAENAVRRNDLNAANALAQRAMETGEDVAKAYALRAVIAQRSNRPEVALPLLEAAGRADPFESRYLFYQAQTLRAQGKLQEAATRLRRALDRVEEASAAENYRLALRLTQVELGDHGAYAEELTRRLSEPNPPSDWLVTAGARDCQAGRFREGAELLRRAFTQSGPAYAAVRLGDVFFRPFADRPELAPLVAQYLPAPAPAAPTPAATPTPPPGLLAAPSGELTALPSPPPAAPPAASPGQP